MNVPEIVEESITHDQEIQNQNKLRFLSASTPIISPLGTPPDNSPILSPIVSPRRAKCDLNSLVIKEGYLYKRGTLNKWNKRWFSLRPNFLSYSTSRDSASTKTIILASVSEIHLGEVIRKRRFTFVIYAGSKALVLAAESSEDCESWLRALKTERNNIDDSHRNSSNNIQLAALQLVNLESSNSPVTSTSNIIQSNSNEPTEADLEKTYLQKYQANGAYEERNFLRAKSALEEYANFELPINVATFFKLFLSDESKEFATAVRATRGETELVIEPWGTNATHGNYREIKYRCPTNATIGPKSTTSTENQTYHLQADLLLFEMAIYAHDVPYCDSFRIETTWEVTPSSAPNTCKIVKKTGIDWIKNPMGMIKKMVKSGSTTQTKQSFEIWHASAKNEAARFKQQFVTKSLNISATGQISRSGNENQPDTAKLPNSNNNASLLGNHRSLQPITTVTPVSKPKESSLLSTIGSVAYNFVTSDFILYMLSSFIGALLGIMFMLFFIK
eukprot:TRINITY_DN994_c1_g1_i2.p1 TRINITY_DN994_c1_g1~~TRINITY_DN994_c1_g1_i2.p1  ORF type:complete len:504 (-),score=229.77 TRINITY_DN994_c1_g1_i2:60-1571(-)